MSKREVKQVVVEGAPAWMATFSDLVTLLLCFFVLLYAGSNVNADKIQQISAALSGAKPNLNPVILDGGGGISSLLGSGITQFPTSGSASAETIENYNQIQNDINSMASDFKTYFAENNLQEKIDVEVGGTFIKLIIKEGILFDKGSAELKKSALITLDKVADELILHGKSDIKIEGHADSDPINTFLYRDNWSLSAERAISVGRYFIKEKGIDPSRIGAEGFGEYKPIAPNDTEENKSKNRRVEIKIMSTTAFE